MQRNIKKLIKMIQVPGRRMVAKIPKKFWNTQNLRKICTIYGIAENRKLVNKLVKK